MNTSRRSFFAALAAIPFLARVKGLFGATTAPILDAPLTQAELDVCFMTAFDKAVEQFDKEDGWMQEPPPLQSVATSVRTFASIDTDGKIRTCDKDGPFTYEVNGKQVKRAVGVDPVPEEADEKDWKDLFFQEIGDALNSRASDHSIVRAHQMPPFKILLTDHGPSRTFSLFRASPFHQG